MLTTRFHLAVETQPAAVAENQPLSAFLLDCLTPLKRSDSFPPAKDGRSYSICDLKNVCNNASTPPSTMRNHHRRISVPIRFQAPRAMDEATAK